MREASKTFFKVMYYVFLIVGILFCITIAGLILGIPMIIGAKKHKAYSLTDLEMLEEKKSSIIGWGIFFGIITFPIGIIIWVFDCLIIQAIDNAVKNKLNPKVIVDGDGKTVNVDTTDKTLGQTVKDGATNVVNSIKDIFSGGKTKIEKQREQIEELSKLKSDGLITDEEYEAKKKKILDI